jgi:hypothetical protein
MFGRVFAAGNCWHFGVAAVCAFFFCVIVLPCHAVFQFCLSLIIKNFWGEGMRHRWLVLNVPGLLLSIILLVAADSARRNEPQLAFKSFMADPVPKSVQITQFGRSQSIGEPMVLGLEFQIDEAEMQVILRNRSCVLADDPTNLVELRFNKLIMSNGSGVRLDPEAFHFHYVSKEDGRWHLFLSRNRTVGNFYYTHYAR